MNVSGQAGKKVGCDVAGKDGVSYFDDTIRIKDGCGIVRGDGAMSHGHATLVIEDPAPAQTRAVTANRAVIDNYCSQNVRNSTAVCQARRSTFSHIAADCTPV